MVVCASYGWQTLSSGVAAWIKYLWDRMAPDLQRSAAAQVDGASMRPTRGAREKSGANRR